MKRSLYDINPTRTSHDVGQKRVLLAADESGCSLTQIAVTDLKAGETAVAHIHPDMQEGFYVLSGELEVTLDGETQLCRPDDFIYVDSGTAHEMKALTDVRIMTIGCVIEAMREKLYPMLFEPNLHEVVWGGQKILNWKQRGSYSDTAANQSTVSAEEGTAEGLIGESWEVSAVPSSSSIVANGTWAGYNLPDVIARRPREILGKAVAARYGSQLPLLAKFIDADKDLSIQVHPDDEMARREHGKLGKSEMWYVIDAKPGAYLYAGFSEELTPEQYKQRVADGTITESLARHEVHPGDVFYLPAGRVHAICSGILLAEIQQSSDVTYRIYDYGRPGIDGKPRELHTELAAQALDYEVQGDYRTTYEHNSSPAGENAKGSVARCLDTTHFSVRIVEATATTHRDLIRYDSFIILMCTHGQCTIRTRATGTEVPLSEGNSCLIPAAIANYDIIPTGEVRLLEAYIDNRPKTFIRTLVNGFRHLRF